MESRKRQEQRNGGKGLEGRKRNVVDEARGIINRKMWLVFHFCIT